jgi:predicted DNA-binding transcriptional regulator AlpA
MPTDDAALLIDDRTAAALAGVSRSTWHVLRAAGRVPPCVRLGRAVRWRRAEVIGWIDAGCPDAATWAAMQASVGRRLRVS